MPQGDLLLVFAALMAGAFVQSAGGFGLALVAVPLTASIIPLAEAVPATTALASLLCALVLYYNRRGVLWTEAMRMLTASLPGILLGVAVLRFADPHWITRGLGLFVLLYALYGLLTDSATRNQQARPEGPLPGVLAGFAGGFFGGLSALNGPPVVLYGSWRRWPPAQFKGTLQCYFLFNNIFITATHLSTGALSGNVFKWLGIGIPALIVGSAAGHALSAKLNPIRFRQMVLVLVLVAGATLLLK